MPDYVSHILHGEQVLDALDKKHRALIDSNILSFNLGLQGPDIFMYHKIVRESPKLIHIGEDWGIERGSTLLKAGMRLQDLPANDGIIPMQEYALVQSKKKEREMLQAFILGYTAHYHLDKWLHPYVGWKAKSGAKVGKYSELHYHGRIEADIDVLLYRHYLNKSVHKFEFFDHHSKDTIYYAPIAKMLCIVLEKIFGVSFQEKDVLSTIKTMKLQRHFYSKGLYRMVKAMQKIFKMDDATIAHFKDEKRAADVNIHKKEEWKNIINGQKSNLSIIQLFENATESAVMDITQIIDAFEKNEVFKIDDELGFMEGLRKLIWKGF